MRANARSACLIKSMASQNRYVNSDGSSHESWNDFQGKNILLPDKIFSIIVSFQWLLLTSVLNLKTNCDLLKYIQFNFQF